MVERLQTNEMMSMVTISNGVAFLSGQIALENKEASLEVQAKEIFGRIEMLLGEAGTSKANLLSAMIWLTDVEDFPAFNTLWSDWIEKGTAPARATVRSDLMMPSLKIEIQVTAAVP